MKLSKGFTKGEQVTWIDNWDMQGTFYYRQAIVYSCGKVQMVLTDEETGEEMARHFRPEPVAALPAETNCGTFKLLTFRGTFKRLTDQEAEAACLAAAAVYLEKQRAEFQQQIDKESNPAGYRDAMRKNLAELHEPRFRKGVTL